MLLLPVKSFQEILFSCCFKLVIQIFVISIGDILSPASVPLSPSAPAPHYQQSLQYIEVRSPEMREISGVYNTKLLLKIFLTFRSG